MESNELMDGEVTRVEHYGLYVKTPKGEALILIPDGVQRAHLGSQGCLPCWGSIMRPPPLLRGETRHPQSDDAFRRVTVRKKGRTESLLCKGVSPCAGRSTATSSHRPRSRFSISKGDRTRETGLRETGLRETRLRVFIVRVPRAKASPGLFLLRVVSPDPLVSVRVSAGYPGRVPVAVEAPCSLRRQPQPAADPTRAASAATDPPGESSSPAPGEPRLPARQMVGSYRYGMLRAIQQGCALMVPTDRRGTLTRGHSNLTVTFLEKPIPTALLGCRSSEAHDR